MPEPSIPRLHQEWERLRIKYGVTGSHADLDRLLMRSRRKQARLRHLKERLADLQTEAATLEAEVEGVDKSLRFLLNEVISEIKVANGPAWSPVAMLGFRIWEVSGSGFHGYREQWLHRSLAARCGTTGAIDDIPHTDGECGDPPCGIYAAKDVRKVIATHASIPLSRLAVGLVAMTGKVVEHQHGWRAAEATVLALALAREGRIHTTDDEQEIELLFQGVGMGGAWNIEPTTPGAGPADPLATIVDYLEQKEMEKTKWISESPNEL